VDADGTYTVKTYKGAGLPVGSYRVAIRPAAPQNPDGKLPLAGDAAKKPDAPPIPPKYLDSKTSGLRIEVHEGDNPAFNFDLEKK
jgi:hypothetical protein